MNVSDRLTIAVPGHQHPEMDLPILTNVSAPSAGYGQGMTVERCRMIFQLSKWRWIAGASDNRRRWGVDFSGAAAIDEDGKFAGIALLKPLVLDGAANAPPAAQAVMASAGAVRDFPTANDITANGNFTDVPIAPAGRGC